MVCGHCGAETPDEFPFCSQCGERLDIAESAAPEPVDGDAAKNETAEPVDRDAVESAPAEPVDSPSVPEEHMWDTAAKPLGPARSATFDSLSRGGYGAGVAAYLAGLVLSLIACLGSTEFVFSAISCAVGAFVLYHAHGSARERRLMLMIPIIWALAGSIVDASAYGDLRYMGSADQGLLLLTIVGTAFCYIGPLVLVHLAFDGRSAERSRHITMAAVVYMAVLVAYELLRVFSRSHVYDGALWLVGFATSSLTLPVAYLLVSVELHRRSQEGRQGLALFSDGLAAAFRVPAVEVGESVANAAVQHTAAGASHQTVAGGDRSLEVPDHKVGAGLGYERLGGWLLFYMVESIASGAYGLFGSILYFAVIGQLRQSLGYGGIFALLDFFVLLAIIFNAIRLWTAFLLYRRDPRFLKIFQIVSIIGIATCVLILAAVVKVLNEMFVLNEVLFLAAGATDRLMYSLALEVIDAIEAICWTVYFCRSVRMRTYMGNEEYLERALFRFDRT